jgi:hypothetical protein
VNSLDMYVGERGRGHLRHYLIDFSSILGAGSNAKREIAPQNPRAGNEYVIDWGPIFRSLFTLGIWDRPWRDVRYPDFPEIGRIEADFFDPHAWKPEYPNPAFERMQPEDAFWAARLVSKFTDEAIRAIVKEGDFRAPEAEAHLARVIVERRDKVVARYLRATNPLAEFRIEEGPGGAVLRFVNSGEDARLGQVEAYEVQWFRFDNPTGRTEPLGPPARVTERALPVPAERPDYLMARMRSVAPGLEAWGKPVDVYVRTGERAAVVGVERGR